jgi:hypothetical protein
MSRRFAPLSAILTIVGALWLFWAGTALAQDVERGPAATPIPEPATLPPGVTPTPDRLAAPPTVPSPNQADEGAQLFWLHCQPCHGDQGQGLTDEWRAQYPPEDQNCWESGCHGDFPYDPAFKLPTAVPAVIGDGTLQKFETLDGVYQYVSVAMPYFFPGDLTQEEYLAITAHLARQNGLWDGATLTTDNLARYRLRAAAPAPAAEGGHLVQPTATAIPGADTTGRQPFGVGLIALGLVGGIVLVTGGLILWRNRGR